MRWRAGSWPLLAWLPAFGATATLLGSPWPWALAVCLGLSALSARWQRGAHHA